MKRIQLHDLNIFFFLHQLLLERYIAIQQLFQDFILLLNIHHIYHHAYRVLIICGSGLGKTNV